MHRVEPKVFVVAETQVDILGLQEYLEEIGAIGWSTDAPSGIEELVEVMGRECYRSFGVGLNKNVTRVREGNAPYIDNIVKVHHGSVVEHGSVSFMLVNVSRILTHELCRHRVGVAISQESLRYVRLNDLGMWVPSCFTTTEKADLIRRGAAIFQQAFESSESAYLRLLQLAADIEGVPNFDAIKDFEKKKKYTSAARRVSPDGLATSIGWTCNMRTLRHVIEQRTHESAEEEIRLVFDEIGGIAQTRWPNLFHDWKREVVDGIGKWSTPNSKI